MLRLLCLNLKAYIGVIMPLGTINSIVLFFMEPLVYISSFAWNLRPYPYFLPLSQGFSSPNYRIISDWVPM